MENYAKRIIPFVTIIPMCILAVTVSIGYKPNGKAIKSDDIDTTYAETITVPYTMSNESIYEIVTDELYYATEQEKLITTTITTTTVPTTTTTITNTAPKTTTETTTSEFIPEEYIPVNREYDHYDYWLWVGDSRTVGLGQSLGTMYFAKSAMGLNWFAENCEEVYNFVDTNIIFNFGINDLGNVYNYANFYNNMPDEFFERNKIFVMSVNPVDEPKEYQYGYSTLNSSIEWFNEELKNNLRDDIYFIDSYDYLQKTGFGTTDGLHYDYYTNVKIYNFMIDTITWTDPNSPKDD